MSTKFLNDILAQPDQWQSCLDYYACEGAPILHMAAKHLKKADRIIISGIGASYNAGIAVECLLKKAGIQTQLEDASELMYHYQPRPGDLMLLLSRSGKSIEMLHVVEMAKKSRIPIISICNDDTSPLALGSDLVLPMKVRFDNSISVSSFSAIILTGIGLAMGEAFVEKGRETVKTTREWLQTLPSEPLLSDWARPQCNYYFLARAGSRAAGQNAALLWQEGAKQPAVAMSTGSFRHGPQEVVSPLLHVMAWLDPGTPYYQHDLALCRDLQTLGVNVLTVGALEQDGGLLFPEVPPPFYLLLQQLPAQLAANLLAVRSGVDPDSFKYCQYIVEKEGGIW